MWCAVTRVYDHIKRRRPGTKGYRRSRRFTAGGSGEPGRWKLSGNRTRVAFTDGHRVRSPKLTGRWDLARCKPDYSPRVPLVHRIDGLDVRLAMPVDPAASVSSPTTMGMLDVLGVMSRLLSRRVGSVSIPAGSARQEADNPCFLRTAPYVTTGESEASTKKGPAAAVESA